MKDIAKLGGILMLVTVIAAAVLSGVNGLTRPLIEEQHRLALERALTQALPDVDADLIEPIGNGDEPLYYVGYESPKKARIVGYAYVAKGKGYSSVIQTMVGVDTNMIVLGMKVLQQVETPGLGTKVEEIKHGESDPWFTRQFIGKQAESFAVDKDKGEIDSITGATISSRALTNSVVAGAKELQQNIKKAGGSATNENYLVF